MTILGSSGLLAWWQGRKLSQAKDDVKADVASVKTDVKALLEPRARKLEGAISGRALYDGRVDPAAALALIKSARAAA